MNFDDAVIELRSYSLTFPVRPNIHYMWDAMKIFTSTQEKVDGDFFEALKTAFLSWIPCLAETCLIIASSRPFIISAKDLTQKHCNVYIADRLSPLSWAFLRTENIHVIISSAIDGFVALCASYNEAQALVECINKHETFYSEEDLVSSYIKTLEEIQGGRKL